MYNFSMPGLGGVRRPRGEVNPFVHLSTLEHRLSAGGTDSYLGGEQGHSVNEEMGRIYQSAKGGPTYRDQTGGETRAQLMWQKAGQLRENESIGDLPGEDLTGHGNGGRVHQGTENKAWAFLNGRETTTT